MASNLTDKDVIRERELFRYFQPLVHGSEDDKASQRQGLDGTDDALVSKAIESPDTTLTALAQLCACRLDASRAMISVIGRQVQHFIAEATRTVQLSDTRKCDDVDDELWVGCASVNKEGRLCEKTIELAPTSDKYACFTVTDLSVDERFKDLPFVSGPPYFRFYAGTPLTTKRGINIGSLFVIDDRVRPELTASQVDFLGTVAKIVMRNMELNHEAEERMRSLKMSGALNAFQEGRSSISNTTRWERARSESGPVLRRRKTKAASSAGSSDDVCGDTTGSTNEQPPTSTEAEDLDRDSSSASDEIPTPEQEQDTKSTFVRAASLLSQSLDLQDTGGVVFIETGVNYLGRTASTPASADLDEKLLPNGLDATSPSGENFRHRTFSRNEEQASSVIGFSAAECTLGSQGDMKNVRSFTPLDQGTLQNLLQNYPRGRLWCFDDDERLSAWDEDLLDGHSSLSSGESAKMRSQRKQNEASQLSKHFPNVRQLLFTPLWDSSAGRWFSGCFCFSTSPRQIYSSEVELSFLCTFCNTVMAEASRIAFMAAERQKGDFVGSISHELRSPLHGILASVEFLADTEFDPFQNNLVDTISSCGRTLLDTVNHILDYSKMNAYEKNWLTAKKSRAQKSTVAIKSRAAVVNQVDKDAPPLMNIYATTDVAAIAEEVVEGVYAGQIYQDISSTDISFMSSDTKSKISERGTAPDRRGLGESGKHAFLKDVEVLLDIARGDFVFTTQPGALRRIIMNLFGNSLKYTDKGRIVVSLTLREMKDEDGTSSTDTLLEINIKDTGKGISSEYLRSNLFTPFSQEDTLATGVGLGLSIVKSIVNTMNGSIEFASQLGQGTEVSVKIPLMRLPGTETAESTPSTVTSSGSISTCMQGLQADHWGKFAALYRGYDDSVANPHHADRARVLYNYITQWYGLKAATDMDPVDIVIVDEKDIPKLQYSKLDRCPTVVLCGASRPRMESKLHNPLAMEYVSKPFGPYKLAKAIYTCLEKAKGNISSEVDPSMTFPEESPISSESGTIVPELGPLDISGQVSSRSPFTEHQSKSDGTDFPFPTTCEDTSHVEHPYEKSAQSSAQDEQTAVGSTPPKSSDRGLTPDLVRRDSRRPRLTQRATEPVIRAKSITSTSTPLTSAVTKSGEVATSSSAEEVSIIPVPLPASKTSDEAKSAKVQRNSAMLDYADRPPRLLLVDDNKINLQLLKTFMKKRKYQSVDSAENGQLAVDAAEAHQQGYDIIFMDISMPVMNGFEATRAIREIEHTRNDFLEAPGPETESQKQHHALIIALTGLASSRDHAEAMESGVDIFLTKPVAFKEVGRILDNWEANRKSGPAAAAGEGSPSPRTKS